MRDEGVEQVRGLPFLDFFAGSGLVTEGLAPYFRAVFANDVCPRKRAVYEANHGAGHFHFGSIEAVRGGELPRAVLSWGSFPCQDLSLAGRGGGLGAGRSGLFWQWLRVMDEMPEPPAVLAAENVAGLLTTAGGAHYRALHEALIARGWRVGAVALDAADWLPQSRPRVFVVAVRADADISGFALAGPGYGHPAMLVKAAEGLSDFVWWRLPEPDRSRRAALQDVIEWDAPCDPPEKSAKLLALVPEAHKRRLDEALADGMRAIPGYRRTRKTGQMFELRFDGLAGCLRAPRGGSSRQYLVLASKGGPATRLLTVREAARLMGAPDSYIIPGRYNDGYHAMGDAVAVPAARHLARHLLAPLARRSA